MHDESRDGAADYPRRAIRFIVPFAAGEPADVVVRLIAQRLSDLWSQPVNVDNLGGQYGIRGLHAAANAAPDGYTIALVNSTHFIHPSVFRNLPFDLLRDYAAVSLFASSPVVLVVHPSLPVRSVGELIAYVKANPGRVKYTSGGAYAGPSHVAGELFKMMAGLDIPYVPSSRGHAAAGAKLSEGSEVQLLFDGVLSALPRVNSGEWRGLAVTSAARSSAVPELPTMAESGLAGYEVSTAMGVLAPAGTAQNIIAKLSREIVSIVQLPDVSDRLHADGKEPVVSTPEQFAAYIKVEISKWASVVAGAGITVQESPRTSGE